jgi:hypothetical protein
MLAEKALKDRHRGTAVNRARRGMITSFGQAPKSPAPALPLTCAASFPTVRTSPVGLPEVGVLEAERMRQPLIEVFLATFR